MNVPSQLSLSATFPLHLETFMTVCASAKVQQISFCIKTAGFYFVSTSVIFIENCQDFSVVQWVIKDSQLVKLHVGAVSLNIGVI